MRQLLYLFVLCLFSPPISYADCASTGVYVYPKSGEIEQNTFILIEGYAYSNETVMEFGKKYTLKLVSDDHEVKLKRLTQYTGMMDLKKIVFKPDSLLRMNETYQLVVEGLDQNHHDYPNYWDAESREEKYYRYTVTKAADHSAPAWKNQPEHKENNQTFFGCGPATYAIFNTEADDASAVIIEANLMNKTSGESTTYILPIKEDNLLLIGHGMCSGAFTFNQGDHYKIRFKLYDICGNTNDTWTKWIAFENPSS